MLGFNRLGAVVTSLAMALPAQAQSSQNPSSSQSLYTTIDGLEQLVAQCNSAQSQESAQARTAAQTKACCTHVEEKIAQLDAHNRFLPVSGRARISRRDAQLLLVECHARLSNTDKAEDTLAQLLAVDQLTSLEKNTLIALNLGELVERTQSKIREQKGAQLQVNCDQACEIWINWTRRYELPASPSASDLSLQLELPFGNYIVAVVDPQSQTKDPSNEGLSPLSQVRVEPITFSERLTRHEINFRAAQRRKPQVAPAEPNTTPPASPAQAQSETAPAPLAAHPQDARNALQLSPLPVVKPILPRPYLQIGVGLGLIAAATGSALMAADGYCTKGGVSCPKQDQWQTKGAGLATLIAGSVLFSTTIAFLIAERVRGKRALRGSTRPNFAQGSLTRLEFGPPR